MFVYSQTRWSVILAAHLCLYKGVRPPETPNFLSSSSLIFAGFLFYHYFPPPTHEPSNIFIYYLTFTITTTTITTTATTTPPTPAMGVKKIISSLEGIPEETQSSINDFNAGLGF